MMMMKQMVMVIIIGTDASRIGTEKTQGSLFDNKRWQRSSSIPVRSETVQRKGIDKWNGENEKKRIIERIHD